MKKVFHYIGGAIVYPVWMVCVYFAIDDTLANNHAWYWNEFAKKEDMQWVGFSITLLSIVLAVLLLLVKLHP